MRRSGRGVKRGGPAQKAAAQLEEEETPAVAGASSACPGLSRQTSKWKRRGSRLHEVHAPGALVPPRRRRVPGGPVPVVSRSAAADYLYPTGFASARRRYGRCGMRSRTATATVAGVPPPTRHAVCALHHQLEEEIRKATAALAAYRRLLAEAERAGRITPQEAVAEAAVVRSVRATVAAGWRAWLRESRPVR
jgi:hypothetical protein